MFDKFVVLSNQNNYMYYDHKAKIIKDVAMGTAAVS